MARLPARHTLLALLVAVAFAGCQKEDAEPATSDEQASFVSLVDRVVSLHRRMETSDRISPDDSAQLNVMLADIREWQKRTGRNDLTIKDPAAGTSARDNDIDVDCECPLVKSYPLELCFLVGTSDCSAGEERGCTYVCVQMPGEVVGMWKPPAAS